jgi:hypothetical protein
LKGEVDRSRVAFVGGLADLGVIDVTTNEVRRVFHRRALSRPGF